MARKRTSITDNSNPSEARQPHHLADPEWWQVEESYATPEQVRELEARLESALQLSDGHWRFRRFEMTATELIAPDSLSKDEADELGQMLSGMNTSAGFWIGDWVNLYIGQDFDKDAISRVYIDLSERFKIKRNLLKNYAYVCRKITPSLRQDALSFSHHIEVAKIPAEAAELLDLAERENMSVRQLRDEVRARLNKRSRRKPVTYRSASKQLTSLSHTLRRLEPADKRQAAAALRQLALELEAE